MLIKKARTGLIAILDWNISYGTLQEMVYAKKIFNKIVYSIITNGVEEHPWLKYHSDKIFTSLNGFEEWITKKVIN